MALVKVKDKFQVTLPLAVRKLARIEVGDFMDAEVSNGEIRLRPKRFIDRAKGKNQ